MECFAQYLSCKCTCQKNRYGCKLSSAHRYDIHICLWERIVFSRSYSGSGSSPLALIYALGSRKTRHFPQLSRSVQGTCCLIAVRGSFWTPLCHLFLGAQAALPPLFLSPLQEERDVLPKSSMLYCPFPFPDSAWCSSPLQELGTGQGWQSRSQDGCCRVQGSCSGCCLCSHASVWLRKPPKSSGHPAQ